MRGIPNMQGQVGRLIGVLDALLVNGFGETTVKEVTVFNKKVTLQITNNETFEKNSIIRITGFDLLNGEHRVEESGTSYIVIHLDIPDQVLNVNLSVKYAPLGWSKIPLTSPANSAVYVPGDPKSRFKLSVLDNYTQASDIRIFKEFLTPNSIAKQNELIGSTPYITDAYSLMWPKSYTSNATARSFFLIGNNSCFYYQLGRTDSGNDSGALRSGKLHGVGDINRFLDTDYGSAFITGFYLANSNLNSFTSSGQEPGFGRVNNKNNGNFGTGFSSFLEKISSTETNDQIYKIPDGPFTTFWSGYNGLPTEYNIDGKGIELYKVLAVSDECKRGYFKGIYYTPNTLERFPDFYIQEGSGDLSGRLLLFKSFAVGNSSYNHSGSYGFNIFDLTGPW